ncbi:hypothetical protein LTR66_009310 [Elasticomyces elasticus]|nr:hypothetical protein LTR66_009310 [Elasticomyces elasticus]
MDSSTLRTASTYLNNLLLARGLLREGTPIDFARPSKSQHGEKQTMAQVINLVHDLILRRDREQEQREAVAMTLRALRAEQTRNATDIGRLKTREEEHARNLAQAQAAERAAKAEVKRVESAMKGLQEQIARLKTTLAQVRTQCSNDVRKRDVQIQRLKAHLQDHQRGNNKGGIVGATITITPTALAAGRRAVDAGTHDLADPEYSLKQETTEFLTQLSQSLSDENDGLIGLIRSAVATVKELLGLPANAHRFADSTVGSLGSQHAADDTMGDGANMLHTLPTSYEALAADLERTITHLKTVLTNPDFVSMEEVEVREDEIARLREGWEKMEARWREVLSMMNGWRRRMESTGDTINLDDLKQGLGLSVGFDGSSQERRGDLVASHDLQEGEEDEVEVAAHEADVSQLGRDDDAETIVQDLGVEDDTGADEEDEEDEKDGGHTVARSPKSPERQPLEPPEFFDLRPHSSGHLRETTGNRRNRMAPVSTSKPDGDHGTERSYPDKKKPALDLATPTIIKQHISRSTRFHSAKTAAPESAAARSTARKPASVKTTSALPRQTRKRLSSPNPHPKERSAKQRTSEPNETIAAESSLFSPTTAEPNPHQHQPEAEEEEKHEERELTLHEKLKAAQTEAEAAAAAAATAAASNNPTKARKEPDRVCFDDGLDDNDDDFGEKGDEVGVIRSPVRKTRIRGRPKRRKSTLNPDELQRLLGLDEGS